MFWALDAVDTRATMPIATSCYLFLFTEWSAHAFGCELRAYEVNGGVNACFRTNFRRFDAEGLKACCPRLASLPATALPSVHNGPQWVALRRPL